MAEKMTIGSFMFYNKLNMTQLVTPKAFSELQKHWWSWTSHCRSLADSSQQGLFFYICLVILDLIMIYINLPRTKIRLTKKASLSLVLHFGAPIPFNFSCIVELLLMLFFKKSYNCINCEHYFPRATNWASIMAMQPVHSLWIPYFEGLCIQLQLDHRAANNIFKS